MAHPACTANCEAVKEDVRVYIKAICNIAPGEELFIDYAPELPSKTKSLSEYACRCGTRRCRGTMLGRARARPACCSDCDRHMEPGRLHHAPHPRRPNGDVGAVAGRNDHQAAERAAVEAAHARPRAPALATQRDKCTTPSTGAGPEADKETSIADSTICWNAAPDKDI